MSDDNFLESFIKQYGMEKNDSGHATGFIDTGSYALNGLLSGTIYGGYPDDRVTALAGEEATGKTFLALSGVKEFVKAVPNSYCLYFETEHSVTAETLTSRGIPVKKCVSLEVDTVEEWKHRVSNMLDGISNSPEKDRKRFMIVLDSLGNLSSSKELKDSISGKETADMTRSKEIRSAFRTITRRLGKLRIPLIVVNHTYEVIGAWTPNKNVKVTSMGGGGGLKYAASSIIYLTKKKDYDKEEKRSNGILIKAKLEKSRFAKPDMTVELALSFDRGLDRYHGLLQFAIEHGILTKKSAGSKGTIIILSDGSDVPLKTFVQNPEKYWTKELLDKVDAQFRITHSFGSGSGDEEYSELENEDVTDENI